MESLPSMLGVYAICLIIIALSLSIEVLVEKGIREVFFLFQGGFSKIGKLLIYFKEIF